MGVTGVPSCGAAAGEEVAAVSPAVSLLGRTGDIA
jgi:hypothetical protein